MSLMRRRFGAEDLRCILPPQANAVHVDVIVSQPWQEVNIAFQCQNDFSFSSQNVKHEF